MFAKIWIVDKKEFTFKSMNEHILQHQKTFETILDTVIEAVITTDERGIILFANKATTNLFGYTTSELIGKDIKLLMPAYHQIRHNNYMKAYLQTKKAKVIGKGRKVHAKKKNGDLFACWIGISDFSINNNIYFTGVLSDISKLEKTQQELEQLNKSLEEKVKKRTRELKTALEKAKELNDLKSKFLTLASHEFKTPLATILSSAILIKKHGDTNANINEKQLKHIERIKRSVNLMDSILSDFINFERIEKNKIHLHYKQFNLLELIQEAVQISQSQITEKQTLELDSNNDHLTIYSDYRICLYVLINLLSNASKFSPPESTIKIKVQESNSNFSISISDQGIGIPEENQKHIFDRFYRADNAEDVKGTGLGLSIAKSYAKLLKGDLNFKSRIGKGSSFKFTIPKTEA